jgi:predicted nucleic acid-binding protein
MATVVVDTCVVSFLHKSHENAKLYQPHLEGNLKVISFMTLAELYRWAIESHWGERRKAELDEAWS